jgi:UDP-glucose-4-epimerase GalE
MSRILVVGGAGYIGSHMVKALLAHGDDVHVLDNLSRGHRDAIGTAKLIEADLLDPPALARALAATRFDAVMHFAALCYVGESVQKPREYWRNNVVGTVNLLDAMLDADVRNFIFSSTCSTFGDPVEIPMRESHPQRPINPYGATKLAVETILREYAAAYGMNSVSLRYFNAAGCDRDGSLGERHSPETHLIPLVLQEALRVRDGADAKATALVVHGGDYDTPDGTCIRDYVHVEDLADAHARALGKLREGLAGASFYNLGIGKGFSVLEVIESARRVTGIPVQYRVGPRRPGDPPRLVADAGAARRDLRWQPSFTNLDDIVATAWRWFSKKS